MTYAVPNHHTCKTSLDIETVWQFRGSKTITLIQGWSVPLAELHKLNLSAYHQAYLTSNGYWCASYSDAVNALKDSYSDCLSIKGNCLSMFIHENWAEENGNPNPASTYHLVRNRNSWDCQPV